VQPGRFALWLPDGTLQVLPSGPAVVSQDRSHQWILIVAEDGTATAHNVAGDSSAPVPGVHDAVAADW
jgi:hypothetical protein